MAVKKISTRYNIQFNNSDPAHLKAVELLSKQGYRGKAQYIINAILHYEGCNANPDMNRMAKVDEKAIEAVVYKILNDREGKVTHNTHDTTAAVDISVKTPHNTETLNFEGDIEKLDAAGFSAITNALDLFRRKSGEK